MNALRIAAAGKCEFLQLPEPKLSNEDDVIVQVKCVGICGSDVHSYAHGANCPVIPGHEVVGIVAEKGKNVSKLDVGDHVVLEPLVSCGECYACEKGYPNVCKNAMCLGCQTDGGMREFFVYDQSHWHKLPQALPFEAAVLIEPYTVGLEVVTRGEVREGDVVLIHGAGPAGLIAMDLSKKLGATCIISDVVDGRLKIAQKLGADYTLNPTKTDLPAFCMDITGGEGPNVIIDAAGLASMMDANVKLVSQAGRIVCMGIDLREASYDMLQVSIKEASIVGSRMQQKRFPAVIANCWDYLKVADRLVTDRFPFAQAEEAMKLAAKAAPDTAKVIVTF